jgi:hypothetical protein
MAFFSYHCADLGTTLSITTFAREEYMKNKRNAYLLFCLLFVAVLMQACRSFPEIDIWAMDEGVYQYYIHPTRLKGVQTEKLVEMDFTVHQYRKNPENNKIFCKFSILKKNDLGSDLSDAYFIINNDPEERIHLKDIELMFIKSKDNKVRFTSLIEDKNFERLVSGREYIFVIEYNTPKETFTFVPTEPFLKQMNAAMTDMYG